MTSIARKNHIRALPEVPSVTNEPIDYSVAYRARERGSARHFGFFPFFAKKPWPVIQEYIKHYTSVGEIVLDPFAGSGVTPVEALVLGRRAIAGDINPVARFITYTTAISPVNIKDLRAVFEGVQNLVKDRIEALELMSQEETQSLLAALDYPRNEIPLTVRRAGASTVDQLHTPKQLAGLALLRQAINTVGQPVLRDLLRVALANTVRYANRMYILPYDKSGKRRSPYRGDVGFLRRSSYSLASEERFYELPVWQTFERAFKNVVDAKEETNSLIGNWYNEDNFRMLSLPASRVGEEVIENSVDYCFTDPPYSNEIYFVDLSTLWASWLDLEISDEVRQAELLIDNKRGKTRKQFEDEFLLSAETIARVLKPDRWFTLVYKHRDLSLWQTIVAACESAGLQYTNSVWQDVLIRSTRQVESPNINPKGDMYLNFRKMTTKRFESIYGSIGHLEIPTRPNYVEHEVERTIVSYLGADIDLIAASTIQQVLDSRAFRDYHESPSRLSQDIDKVLKSPRFRIWRHENGLTDWIMSSEITLDISLPVIDRARYHLFSLEIIPICAILHPPIMEVQHGATNVSGPGDRPGESASLDQRDGRRVCGTGGPI